MGTPQSSRVFLDASGSAPLSPRTREALVAAIDEGWADPDRLHSESRRAHALLDGAAQAIAAVVGAPAEHTHFVPTFGLAFDRTIGGVAKARGERAHIVATAVERKPVLRVASRFASTVNQVAVDEAGIVDLDAVAASVTDDTSLVLVQHANQESGTIQPLSAAHEIARAAGAPLVVDATASIGHVDPPAAWDALMADPADWGGPRGVAVVAFRATTRWAPLPPVVTGRVNVPAALAAAVALEEREEHRREVAPRLAGLAARVRAAARELPGATVFAPPESSLPHLVTFVVDGMDGEALSSELDRRGFAVGSGSACTTEPSPESHVWEALGVRAHGVVRMGLHPGISDADVDAFCQALRLAADAVRGNAPTP